MSADADILRKALKFLCCEEGFEQVCRLCLQSTKNAKVGLADKLFIQKPYFNGDMTVLDVLTELDFSTNDDLPQVFCNDCTSTIVNTFLFKKLCQYSEETWNLALNKLENSLAKLGNITRENVQTTFLTISNEDIVYTTSKEIKNKTKAATRLNNVIRTKRYYNVNKLIGAKQKTSASKLIEKEILKKINDRIPCTECHKVFPTLKQVASHMERLHKPKKVLCLKCKKKFPTKSQLSIHEREHHIPATCNLCSLKFPNRYTLRRHMNKHGDHHCTNCNKKFKDKLYYQYHVKNCCSKTKSADETFTCDLCDKTYLRKNSLRSHLKVEHGFGRVYQCTWCGKKFDAVSRLDSHVVKHTKDKNFHCEMCGCKFVTSAALVYHQRLHTGEKPFPCDMCEESFLSASRRMEHKNRKHFGPRKACPRCPMKFITEYELKKHVVRHDNPQSRLFLINRKSIEKCYM